MNPVKEQPKRTRQLEVNGVRFTMDEVKSVTIKRGGKDIYIERPEGPKPIGFERKP